MSGRQRRKEGFARRPVSSIGIKFLCRVCGFPVRIGRGHEHRDCVKALEAAARDAKGTEGAR